MVFRLIIVFISSSTFLAFEKNEYTTEYEKIKGILKDEYDKSVIPKISYHDPLLVSIVFSFKMVSQLSVSTAEMMSAYFLCVQWNDYRLTWKSDNITKIVLDSEDIWTPNIELDNVIEIKSSEKHSAELDNDGNVSLCMNQYATSICQANVRNFPFDTQECLLVFYSHAYGSEDIKLHMQEYQAMKKFYKAMFQDVNGWELLAVDSVQFEGYRRFESESTMSVLIVCKDISRNPMDPFLTILCPTFLISMLSLLTFLLPNESGDKLEFGVTVFLTLCVNALVIKEAIPSKTTHVPIITQMNTAVTAMVAISIFAGILTTRILKNPKSMPSIPKCIHWMLYYIGKVLCVSFKIRSIQQYHEAETEAIEINCDSISEPRHGEFENEMLRKIKEIHECIKKADESNQAHKEWLKVTVVIDRMFAVFFILMFTIGIYILCKSLILNKVDYSECASNL